MEDKQLYPEVYVDTVLPTYHKFDFEITQNWQHWTGKRKQIHQVLTMHVWKISILMIIFSFPDNGLVLEQKQEKVKSAIYQYLNVLQRSFNTVFQWRRRKGNVWVSLTTNITMHLTEGFDSLGLSQPQQDHRSRNTPPMKNHETFPRGVFGLRRQPTRPQIKRNKRLSESMRPAIRPKLR